MNFDPLLLLSLIPVLLLIWWWAARRAHLARGEGLLGGLDTLLAWAPEATRVLKAAERSAYVTLRRALPQHMILAQVPLARFIRVRTRYSYAEWMRRVGQLCADLVVCDRNSQVIAVVEVHAVPELTGHRTRRRQLRLARVLEAAQIPLHVWIDTALPSPETARNAILPHLRIDAVRPEAAPAADPPGQPDNGPDTMADDGPAWDADEVIDMPEPPASTWFDDFDSAPTAPGRLKAPRTR